MVLCGTAAPGCVIFEGDGGRGDASTWYVEIGLPEQTVPLAALGGADQDEWLADGPWAALDMGLGEIAAPFAADTDDETQVVLLGMYDTGDEHLWLHADPTDASGIDHGVWFRVRIASQGGVAEDTWVGASLEGDPGCGGDPLPTAVDLFDADRVSLPFDGTNVLVSGLRVVFRVAEQYCAVAE
jgi:hypothetical protein